MSTPEDVKKVEVGVESANEVPKSKENVSAGETLKGVEKAVEDFEEKNNRSLDTVLNNPNISEEEVEKVGTIIAQSADGASQLYVRAEGEIMKLSPEEKAKIPQEISKAEEKLKKELERIEKKYNEKPNKTAMDGKIREINTRRAQDSYNSRVNFLQKLQNRE